MRLITFLFVLLTAASVRLWAADESRGVKALLRDHGTKTVIARASPDFQNLVATCEAALASAPRENMAELAVFPSTIEDIEKKGVSVELILPKVHHFRQNSSTDARTVEANRLLIELYGPHAEGMRDGRVLIFYGEFSVSGGAYSSGPYVSLPAYGQDIRDLLAKIGYKVK